MKAVVAVEHAILTEAWHMVADGKCNTGPGADHFARLDPIRAKLGRQEITSVGFNVTFTPDVAV